MTEAERVELDLLVEGVRSVHGYNLGALSRPVLVQAVRAFCELRGHAYISAAQAELIHQRDGLDVLIELLGGGEEQLFQDAEFWRNLRRYVVPVLRTYPSIKVWHVECGGGVDTYALAILLAEEGLLGKTRIYATAATEAQLARARAGRLPGDAREASALHFGAGGLQPLGHWTAVEGGVLVLKPELSSRLFFTQHHLATDSSFNEFQLVLCRNVLLRFNRTAHERIHGQLFESLARFGYLGLGRKESVALSPYVASYEELEDTGRLFRRAA